MINGESPPGPETEKAADGQSTTKASELSAELIAQGHSQRNGNSFGPLRKVLQTAIDEATLNDVSASLADYTVLSPQNDPYRLDLPDNHQNGAWFKEVVERLVPDGQSVHLRGLHYRLVVAAADVIRPDNGKPYINTEEAWLWLTTKAAKAGRWLGYVPFERISDERNAAPEFFLSSCDAWLRSELSRGTSVEVPSLDRALPTFHAVGFDVRQPYRIICIGEKTSLREVLLPIAKMVAGELLLPTGEASDTMIAGIAARASTDNRPSVVLYFSDFDPSGHQMPVSVSRKLQALRDLRYPGLNIEVHHIALTLDQVRQLDLPSTPLKETERRADRWRAVMQHEQTEIDALAALRPQELRSIALDAIKPFYDERLAGNVSYAYYQWQESATALLESHPWYQAAVANISDARAALEEAADAFHSAQEAAQDAFEDIELPPIVVPEPMIDQVAPLPLFTTHDGYINASRRLIAHKALNAQ